LMQEPLYCVGCASQQSTQVSSGEEKRESRRERIDEREERERRGEERREGEFELTIRLFSAQRVAREDL
jgi:hypothetical protein